MIDNFDPNFLYRIITIIDTPQDGVLWHMCASTELWLVSGGTQGNFPDETSATLDICATAQVQHFAIMVKHLIMSLSIEVWVRLFQIGIFTTGNCPHVCWNGKRESGSDARWII